MNWAEWLLSVAGAVVVLSIATVVVLWCYDSVRDRFGASHVPSFTAGERSARYCLERESWWFSEDPITMNLIQDLAKGGALTDIRQRWRRAREQESENIFGETDHRC
jgi:hypothetical protein